MAMASYLAARGVPADRILREDRSRNTEENLANSARVMRRADPPVSGVSTEWGAFGA